MPTNYGQALDELANEVSQIAESKGFWDWETSDLAVIPIKLALVHEEVSEALRVHREIYNDDISDPTTDLTPMQEERFTEELADIIIRVLDIAGYYDFDLGDTLVTKVEANKARSNRHGHRY